MKIKVSVSEDELRKMDIEYQDLQELIYNDLVSSDIDNDYPDIYVEVEVSDENS